MGCTSSSGKAFPSTISLQPQSILNEKAEDSTEYNQVEDEDDIYVTMEEAVAFVAQELGMEYDRAEQLVLTVDANNDGLVSSVELVILNERIKEVKNTLAPKFEEYDTEGLGKVTPTDALKILAAEFDGLPESSIRAMVFRFDSNNDNMVDFQEFVEFYAFIKAKRQSLEKKFEELDTNGSGDLDADELVETLAKECVLKHFQARSLVDDFDLNHNGSLDKEEFMAMWFKLFG